MIKLSLSMMNKELNDCHLSLALFWQLDINVMWFKRYDAAHTAAHATLVTTHEQFKAIVISSKLHCIPLKLCSILISILSIKILMRV